MVLLAFHADSYGPQVAEILALNDAAGGARAMDLFPGACTNETVRDILMKADAAQLFPGARDPESALSGLLLYFSCLKEAHDLLHTFGGGESAYWHGIMHRMEGDTYNAGYWFRRVRRHPLFPALQHEAAQLGYGLGREWDSLAFVDFCEAAAHTEERRSKEDLAKRIQLIEWQLLFDYCAAPATAAESVAAR